MPFNVMMVFGTRPEAIKMAPLARVLREWPDIELNICSTGQHREMLRHLPHALAGSVPQVASPLRFGSRPAIAKSGPPALGQHTQEVLQRLGIGADRLEALRRKGVV